MKQYLRWIDTNTVGNRNDVTPLFAHPADFNELVDDLVACVADTTVDLVACIDALGFILGTAIAQKLGVGILTVRKGGKLPVETDRMEFRLHGAGQAVGDTPRCPVSRIARIDR